MSQAPTVEEALALYGGQSGEELVVATTHPTFATSLEGLDGTGKTLYILKTAPLPMVYVNFGDRDPYVILNESGMEERRKHITVYQFQSTSVDGWTRKEGDESLAAMAQLARAHLSDGKMVGGTFALDSGSTWWDVMQECKVAPEEEKAVAAAVAKGKDFRKSGGLIYTKANLVVSGVLNWIKAQGVYLIITHQKAEKWGPNGPILGQYKSRINSKVPGLMEVRINMKKVCKVCEGDECEAKTHMGRDFLGQIIKFGHDGSTIEGMTFGGTKGQSGVDFSLIYQLYTGAKYEPSI